MPLKPKVTVIGAPMDLGAGRRGVDMGPSAIRYAMLQKRLESVGLDVLDAGNLEVPVVESLPGPAPGSKLKFETEILDVCKRLESVCYDSFEQGRLPVVLGGDHSLAIGSIRAAIRANPGAGLLYFDAHGDCNTEKTTPSGNIHGMSLAALLGLQFFSQAAIEPQRTALIGLRSVDQGEKKLLRDLGVTVYTMHEIDRYGMGPVVEEALRMVGPKAHLSFDLDCLDPDIAPGVGTPVKGGLSYREAFLALELIAEAGVVTSVDMVELNPILDQKNATGELAVSLIAAALGERIL